MATRLKPSVSSGQTVVLGLSGGVDSVVLLDALARLAPRMRFSLEALHINHQLSPNAASWARFCRALCRSRGVPCRVVRVDVDRRNSVERAAREARHAAFLALRAEHIALAHNQDDQVETLVLQLLRGAGVKGLSGMPFTTSGAKRSVLRPLLEVPRCEIVRYGERRKLEWIDDESNEDTAFTRNWLRHEIMPRIARRVPHYRETLARAAAHFAEAAELLNDLASLDAKSVVRKDALSIDALRALQPARAKNLVRYIVAKNGWRMPEADRLTEALRQALAAKADKGPVVNLGDCELRRHSGDLYLLPRSHPAVHADPITWCGEREIALPASGGVLKMSPGRGRGLSAARLQCATVTIRQRRGGERLQPDPGRPRRTVKNLLQETRVPPWTRERLPFIYCGDVLACVPGVAVDWRFQASRGEPSILPVWQNAASVGCE